VRAEFWTGIVTATLRAMDDSLDMACDECDARQVVALLSDGTALCACCAAIKWKIASSDPVEVKAEISRRGARCRARERTYVRVWEALSGLRRRRKAPALLPAPLVLADDTRPPVASTLGGCQGRKYPRQASENAENRAAVIPAVKSAFSDAAFPPLFTRPVA
jgi:hypothetical protein